jgi:hypothetical protein
MTVKRIGPRHSRRVYGGCLTVDFRTVALM